MATLTLSEMREVIALTEELLTRTRGETDRMDAHQQLATLYSRMLSAQPANSPPTPAWPSSPGSRTAAAAC